MRFHHEGRVELLDAEKPDLLLILVPKGMMDGNDSRQYSRKLADLMLRQHRSGRLFATYGNTWWPIWDSSAPPHGWSELHKEPGLQMVDLRLPLKVWIMVASTQKGIIIF